MSAANRPLRGAAQVAGGLLLLPLAPAAAGVLVAGGWLSTLTGSAVLWGLAWRMTRPPKHRHQWQYGPPTVTGWRTVRCDECGRTDIA